MKTTLILTRVLSRLKEFSIQEILPNVYAFFAERRIRHQIADLLRVDTPFSADQDPDIDNFVKELDHYADGQANRIKAIDEKAKSSLLIITVSSTVLLTGLNLIREGRVTFRTPLVLIIALGVVYLVLSAITSVKALNLSPFYVSHPDTWIKKEETKKTITSFKKIDKASLLYDTLILNDRILNIRGNFVSATLIGIRNGVVLLALAFALAISNIGNQVKYPEIPVVQKVSESTRAEQDMVEGHQNPVLPPEGPAPSNDQQEMNSNQSEVEPAVKERRSAMLEIIKSATFWSAIGAVAMLISAGAIVFAARQLRFQAWLKAQEIWVADSFTAARGKVFARLDSLTQGWNEAEKDTGLYVCRRMDEFVRLAPYVREGRMLKVWGHPLAKAWIVLEPLVSEERERTGWPTKWDAFERLGKKALKARPELRRKRNEMRAGIEAGSTPHC